MRWLKPANYIHYYMLIKLVVPLETFFFFFFGIGVRFLTKDLMEWERGFYCHGNESVVFKLT